MGRKRKPQIKKSSPNQSTWHTHPIHWLPLNNIQIFFIFISILTPIVFGLLSVSFGQDNNWDLRNYHYYNPYAFFNGRFLFDYAPAQLQTFINPALDFPFYFFVTQFSPKTVGFAMGAIQGFNFFILFSICYYLFLHKPPSTRLLFALISAAVGVYAPIMIGELGNSTNDIVTSLFALGAVLIIVRQLGRKDEVDAPALNYALIAAGVLVGLGAGLKLTLAVYGIGLLFAQLLLQNNWTQRLKSSAVTIAGMIGGLLISSGFWMYRLWAAFGNPLFPFYNNIFNSPYYPFKNFADTRFLPSGFFDHLFFPFFLLFSNRYTDPQHHYRDPRFAIVFLLVLIATVIFFAKRSKATPKSNYSVKEKKIKLIHIFLFSFFLVSYILWQIKFSILRYTSALEMLAPAVIFILLFYIITNKYYRLLTYILLLVMITTGMRAIQTDRLPWGSTFFQVQVPRFADPDHTIILVSQNRPWSYVIPTFPETIRFLSVNNNFTKPNHNTMFQQEMLQILNSHDGPLYLMSRKEYLPYDARLLVSYRLGIDPRGSLPIRSRHERDGLRLWTVKQWK